MEDLGRYISVNTPDLIERVFDNPGSSILKIPFNTFKMLLGMVAQRAIELNDPELNILMLRLALYEANPDERGELIDKEYEKLNKEINSLSKRITELQSEWFYVKEKLPPEPETKDGISYPLTYICAYRIKDNGYETGDFMYMGNGEFLGENKEYPIYAWLSPSVTIPEFKE